MPKELLNIKRDNNTFLHIQEFEEGRKSLHINAGYQGIVDQFRKGETIKDIKAVALQYLKKELQQEFDHQYSSKKYLEWLYDALLNSNQLQLF